MAYSFELRSSSAPHYHDVALTTYLRLDGAYYSLVNADLRELVLSYEKMHDRDANCDSASKICCGTGTTSTIGALCSKIHPLIAVASLVSAIAAKCISYKAHNSAEALSTDIRTFIVTNNIEPVDVVDNQRTRIISIGHEKQIVLRENSVVD